MNYPVFLSDRHRRQLEDSIAPIPTEPTAELDDPDYNIIQAIKNSARIVADESKSKRDRAVHLCWIFHLVADSHQPLHGAAVFTPRTFPRGDRGGTRTLVSPEETLHKYWDRRLFHSSTIRILVREAQAILDDPVLSDCGNDCAVDMEPETWVQESVEIAQSFAYSSAIRDSIFEAERTGRRMERVRLSNSYKREAGQISRERAIMAGFRLAFLIDTIFGHHHGEDDEE